MMIPNNQFNEAKSKSTIENAEQKFALLRLESESDFVMRFE